MSEALGTSKKKSRSGFKTFIVVLFLLIFMAVNISAEIVTYKDSGNKQYTIDGDFVNWCTARLSNKGTYISLEESYYDSSSKSWSTYKEVDTIPTSRYTVDSYVKTIEGKGILMDDEYVFLNVRQGEGKPYYWKDGAYTYYLVKIYQVKRWM